MKSFLRICAVLFLALGFPASAQFAIFQVNGLSVGTGGAAGLRAANVFGVDQSTWNTPSSYYTPGIGSPAVSTADYYHMGGLEWMRPYDLASADCVAAGATTTRGRYLWIASPDHPNFQYSWSDEQDFRIGYSNDPGVFPSRLETVILFNNSKTAPVGVVTGRIDNGTPGNAGTVLTISAVISGYVSDSSIITGTGVSANSSLRLASGVGGTGVYTASPSQSVASTTLTISQRTFSLYQAPYFVCNPDDTSNPFYLYAEAGLLATSDIQHEEGYAKSADLQTWTVQGPSHINLNGTNWSSFQRVKRTGVNTWSSQGLKAFQTFYGSPNAFGNGLWSSTDGAAWVPTDTTQFNVCIPANSGTQPCTSGTDRSITMSGFETVSIAGVTYLYGKDGPSNGTLSGGSLVSRAPINATTYAVLVTPTRTPISSQYTNLFPGPGFLQAVSNYVEDGVAHIYAQVGFPPSSLNQGVVNGATYNAVVATGAITGTNLLTVSAVASGTIVNNSIVYGAGITGPGVGSTCTITSFGTGTGGTGTYNLSSPCSNFSSGQITIIRGGLWQQAIDYYTEVVDASAAAQAAPVGVTVSAASGVVTLAWYDALPNRTYRVYRGNAVAQTTLIGDVNAISATDATAPQNQVNYYKVVTLQSGTERGSRLVSTFVSSSTTFVNQHITRVLAAGADFATIDRAWLDQVDAWLTTNSLRSSLMFWTNPAFGVVKNAAGTISTIMDLGTTQLPRGGDYTPCGASPCTTGGAGSTTTYDPIGIGVVPAWVNANTTSHGYFGGPGTAAIPGRVNNFRRKTQITLMAAYKKPSTGAGSFFGYSEFSGGGGRMALYHTAGTPGDVTIDLSDATHTVTATKASSSATAFHVAAGTFDGTTLFAYSDGAAGTGATGLVIPDTQLNLTNNDNLTGQLGGILTDVQFLGSGSTEGKYSYGTGYIYDHNEAQYSATDLIVFEKALTPTQVADLTTILTNRQAPVVAQSFTITSAPYSANCNGVADTSAKFTQALGDMVAWDAANPAVPGEIVLNIPNSTCLFSQGGASVYLVKGIVNHTVRVKGAGTSAKLSDGGTGGGFFPGALGQFNDNTHQALISTASKGATSVTLSACPGAGCTAALALYTVGQYALVTGGDMQGEGFPTNPWFWDFVLVSGKTATDVQFATTPLTNNYKSTWPSYSTGGAFAVNQGGPATIYALDPSWGLTAIYDTLILDQTNSASAGYSIPGKSITLQNVTINGTTTCGVPSQTQSFQLIKVTMTSCTYEVDKLIDTLKMQNVSAISLIDFQTSSVKTFELDKSTVTTLNGGGIANYISGSTLTSFAAGAHSFGASTGPLVVSNTAITTLTNGGASSNNINLRFSSWTGGTMTIPPNRTISAAAAGTANRILLTVNSSAGYSTNMVTSVNASPCSSGLQDFTISAVPDGTHIELAGTTFSATCTGTLGALPLTPLNGMVPGANVYFSSAGTTMGPVLQVADMTQDSTGTHITFNQGGSAYTGGFPTMALSGSPNTASIKTHPAPQFTCTTCTGSAAALALSRATPGLPLWSYFDQTYVSATTPFLVPIWGSLVNLSVAVNVAGNGGSGFNLSGPFVDILNTATRATWTNDLINGAITGTRTMTPTTPGGAQSGDTWLAPGAGAWWENDQMTPTWTGTVGSGSIRVLMTTNQGVINSP